jgi:hypothetical protein
MDPEQQAAIPVTQALLRTWGISSLVSLTSGITWQELATLPVHDSVKKHSLT